MGIILLNNAFMKRLLSWIFFILLAPGIFFPSRCPALDEAPALYEKGVEAYNNFSDDQIESAIILFNGSIEKDPAFSPAYSALAEAYIQKYLRSSERPPRLIEKAAVAAEKALFINARSWQAHKAIASVYFAKGMVNEAVEELERAIDMVPDYARALLNLGTCWLDLGDRERGLAFFKDAIKAGNDKLAEGIAYFNLASLEAEEKKYDNALANYRKALELVPGYYNIHYGLGVVYMNRGNDKEALKAFKEAVRLKGDYAPAHIGLASAYHRLGNKGEAMKAYERALALDPESEEAARGLAALSGKKIGCLFIY